MRLSFSFRVPIVDRFKILFLGGFNFYVDYRGQHQINNARCTPMRVKKSDTTITKEKE
jgi:hypothetical protein